MQSTETRIAIQIFQSNSHWQVEITQRDFKSFQIKHKYSSNPATRQADQEIYSGL